MELKVWVEGIQRVVCGVTEVTTCQDVVYALAHATGKTGRFTLMERWRNSERLLAPHEHPLKVLLKWGEYASDVQFILHRTALETKLPENTLTHHRTMPQLQSSGMQQKMPSKNVTDTAYRSSPQLPLQHKDIKKSLTFSGVHAHHLHSSGDSAGSSPVGGQSEVGGLIRMGSNRRISPNHPSPPPSHNPIPRNHSRSLNRPLVPPPYEYVKGNPPPPPFSNAGNARFFNPPCSTAPYPKDRPQSHNYNPYPAKGHSHPLHANSASKGRDLPPYREPPPPPPPSHPSLLKISQNSASAHSQTNSSQHPNSDVFQSVHVESESKFASSAAQRVSNAVIVPLSTSLKNSFETRSSPQGPQHSPNPNSCHPPNLAIKTPPGNFVVSQDSSVSMKAKKDIPTKDSSELMDCAKSDASHLAREDPLSRLAGSDHQGHPGPVSTADSPSALYRQSLPDHSPQQLVPGKTKDKPSLFHSKATDTAKHPGSASPAKTDPSRPALLGPSANSHPAPPDTEHVVVDAYYKELVGLVNEQREKITAQHIDLTKFEAEIAFFEGHFKEDESKLSYFRKEIERLESLPVITSATESQKILKDLEEELKKAKESECYSLNELSSLKVKMAGVDQQLSQMKSRIKSIEESIEKERRRQAERVEAELEEEESAAAAEMDRIRASLGRSEDQLEATRETARELTEQTHDLETRLEEKKKELEGLKEAMRSANLDALSMVPPEEGKGFLEGRTGSIKAGSSRRMVGSPRQLENAVPTAKNPHGVWV